MLTESNVNAQTLVSCKTGALRRSANEDNEKSQTKRAQPGKPGKARGPMQRDVKDVMAELVARLGQKLDTKSARSCADEEVVQ